MNVVRDEIPWRFSTKQPKRQWETPGRYAPWKLRESSSATVAHSLLAR